MRCKKKRKNFFRHHFNWKYNGKFIGLTLWCKPHKILYSQNCLYMNAIIVYVCTYFPFVSSGSFSDFICMHSYYQPSTWNGQPKKNEKQFEFNRKLKLKNKIKSHNKKLKSKTCSFKMKIIVFFLSHFSFIIVIYILYRHVCRFWLWMHGILAFWFSAVYRSSWRFDVEFYDQPFTIQARASYDHSYTKLTLCVFSSIVVVVVVLSLHLCVFMSCKRVYIGIYGMYEIYTVYKNEMKTRLSRSYRIFNRGGQQQKHTQYNKKKWTNPETN